MSVGKKLRNLRQESKRTLKAQSEIFGVSLNSVYRWEHNLTMPKQKILKKIAEFYGVPFEWLCSDSDWEDVLMSGPDRSLDNGLEEELVKKFRKLPIASRYKALGYIERLYIECLDKDRNEDDPSGSSE